MLIPKTGQAVEALGWHTAALVDAGVRASLSATLGVTEDKVLATLAERALVITYYRLNYVIERHNSYSDTLRGKSWILVREAMSLHRVAKELVGRYFDAAEAYILFDELKDHFGPATILPPKPKPPKAPKPPKLKFKRPSPPPVKDESPSHRLSPKRRVVVAEVVEPVEVEKIEDRVDPVILQEKIAAGLTIKLIADDLGIEYSDAYSAIEKHGLLEQYRKSVQFKTRFTWMARYLRLHP